MSYLYVSRGPNGYLVGMDIHRVWTWTQLFTQGYFRGRAKTVFMDMDMDLRLFNPIQTRPIAILNGGKLHGNISRNGYGNAMIGRYGSCFEEDIWWVYDTGERCAVLERLAMVEG